MSEAFCQYEAEGQWRRTPPGVDLATTQSLGLNLVNFLAKYQMRAKIEVNTGNGAEFIFRSRE
jgi:two-component sensor histidine kinase